MNTHPVLTTMTRAGRVVPAWLIDGRLLPVVAGGSDDGGSGGGGGGGDDMVPKAKVNEIVEGRLARQKAALLAEIGDLDALRQKAAEYDQIKPELDQIKAAQQTDVERLQALLDAKNAENAELAAARDKLGSTLSEERRRSAVWSEAVKQKVIDPEAVWAFANRDKVVIGDDGAITGVEDVVKAVLESKPYLVGATGPRRDPAQGAGHGEGGTTGLTAGRERGRADREQAQAQQAKRDPLEGMTVLR